MNDHAHTERQALIASTAPATEAELRLNQELAFHKARADRMEVAIREILMIFPNINLRMRRILERSLTR